jgi:hypothetical protein
MMKGTRKIKKKIVGVKKMSNAKAQKPTLVLGLRIKV